MLPVTSVTAPVTVARSACAKASTANRVASPNRHAGRMHGRFIQTSRIFGSFEVYTGFWPRARARRHFGLPFSPTAALSYTRTDLPQGSVPPPFPGLSNLLGFCTLGKEPLPG